ncbi:MAG TPA: hypothetical protein PLR71_12725, partial [Deltaproteobacteria bacterium]|nr:hypothetical protein [Deltaproteobacteria bacterium]
DGLVASSEETFLSLGDDLREFHHRAQVMCAKSSEIVAVMTGESFAQAIEGLSSILDELKGFMEGHTGSFERISEVFFEHQRTLRKVSSSLEGLNMLVMNLSMLGFLTRMENAHIFSQTGGFASLTEDVKRLVETIKDKSRQMDMKSDAVLAFIAGAIAKVHDYQTVQREQVRLMLERAAHNHRSLTDKHSATSQSVSMIEQGAKNIATSMGDIVMSMQFHDITRQQVEHVKEVMENLRVKINEGGHALDEVAAFVRDVCDLQHAQLRQSTDDLSGAVSKIIENLRAIGSSVGQIRIVTEDAAMASETHGVSFMEEIDAGISSIVKSMRDSSREQEHITKTVDSTSEMVSEMSTFVHDIEAMGMNLQLIALNARIKAAHLGREGAVLDTISGGIYELSKAARDDTHHLSEMLMELVSLSKAFREDFHVIQEGQEHAVEHMVEQLGGLIHSLKDTDTRVLDMLTELSGFADSLMRDVENTASTITIHRQLQEKLQGVMEAVSGVAEHARKICPNRHIDATCFRDIDKLYTMESERVVHMKKLGRTQDAPGQDKQAAPADDLGENVELF